MNKINNSEKLFHLSVVVTSRNDNHGGNLIARMQLFIDGFIHQCRQYDLSAELILVEWNPPEGKISLAEALNFPQESNGPWAIRIITVPSELHMKLKHSEHLPLFQMIAKNIGIRRSLGKYILATNVDILFSNELIQYIKYKLKPHYLYRADRFDTRIELPIPVSMKELLSHCKLNTFRINTKLGTIVKINSRWKKNNFVLLKKKLVLFFLNLVRFISGRDFNLIKQAYRKIIHIKSAITKYRSGDIKLHTNACGDFTLMSYENWFDLRGYPEWDIFSWHLDSVLLYQANRSGIKEMDLPETMNIYHIEHDAGYRPEEESKLFHWLDDKKISYLSWSDFCNIVNEMNNKKIIKNNIIYNQKDWGYVNNTFKEVWVTTARGHQTNSTDCSQALMT